EHNFGHGNQHLATVFANLMMLAFLVDQIQQRCCKLFQTAQQTAISRTRFWSQLRSYFMNFVVDSWDALYNAIAFGIERAPLPFNTS
ncbi:MAG: transposase, partial [Desulfobacterales bacterium]|nr:transposase [Desulfobacterales bacterium]